jgi:hypothetical protein
MNKISKGCFVVILMILLCSCLGKKTLKKEASFSKNNTVDIDSAKIQVLNFATFHMRATPDAHSIEFDQKSDKSKNEVHAIARQLAKFKPTVIIVEKLPRYNDTLKQNYSEYLKNPSMKFIAPSEIELLAFELGRLTGVEQMYGINHKLGYNYRIENKIVNSIDSLTTKEFFKDPFKNFPEMGKNQSNYSILDKLKLHNKNSFLDFLIEGNADILTHVGTPNNFEGADEAAKFYKRNLRMYSNLNRIQLKKTDRVFILMGATHTAFFRDFISRSPKYKMVNTFDYLK